jgi:hypothetical protein
MSDWTRSDTIEGNGYFWTNDDETISAFEDTSDGFSEWYAWRGSVDDHDREMGKSMTTLYPTRDEAVAALDEDN